MWSRHLVDSSAAWHWVILSRPTSSPPPIWCSDLWVALAEITKLHQWLCWDKKNFLFLYATGTWGLYVWSNNSQWQFALEIVDTFGLKECSQFSYVVSDFSSSQESILLLLLQFLLLSHYSYHLKEIHCIYVEFFILSSYLLSLRGSYFNLNSEWFGSIFCKTVLIEL